MANGLYVFSFNEDIGAVEICGGYNGSVLYQYAHDQKGVSIGSKLLGWIRSWACPFVPFRSAQVTSGRAIRYKSALVVPPRLRAFHYYPSRNLRASSHSEPVDHERYHETSEPRELVKHRNCLYPETDQRGEHTC